MELKYYFPSTLSRGQEVEYVYDAEVADYINYIRRRYPGKDIYFAKEAWKNYRTEDENIETLAEECDIISEEDITYETSEGSYFIKNVFEVADEDTLKEMFEDEMKDYFEDDARELFDDEELYHTDPYKYNGVDPRDFY